MEFATLAAYKPAKTGELAKSTASSCLNMNKLIGQEVEHMQIFHSFQPPQVPWIYILHFSLYIPWIIFQNPQSRGQMVRSSQQCLLFITLPTNNVTSCSLLVWAENEQLGSMRSSTRRTDGRWPEQQLQKSGTQHARWKEEHQLCTLCVGHQHQNTNEQSILCCFPSDWHIFH